MCTEEGRPICVGVKRQTPRATSPLQFREVFFRGGHLGLFRLYSVEEILSFLEV